ncbi:MAG: glycosyltransferase family 4 protein [Steroidobacteraceae bacterium]
MIIGWISIAALFASYALTAWLLRHSGVKGIVDRPNSRSSHSTPTPRGGGLSMVAVTSCGVLILYAAGMLSLPMTAVLSLGGLSVAAVGFWDDVRSVPIAVRMIVHFGAAALAVYCLGNTSAIRIGDFLVDLGAIGPVLRVLAIVWVLNLFNFMDGIDGIAASEAVFILFGAAGLGLIAAQCTPAQVAPALIVGAACLGFLRWNWPPAAIFMGDVGSGYLGYAIAVIAIDSFQSSAVNIYAWIILGGVFLVDATLTLCRRLIRRERVYQAHRTHAYQWLARRWGSHSSVTIAVIIINLVWLLPCAAIAVKFPGYALWVCTLALAPLAASAFLIGSGRPE